MRDANRRLNFYEQLQRHAGLSWFPLSISISMFCLFSAFGLAAGQVQEALATYAADRARPWENFAWTRMGVTFLAIFGFAATLRYWTGRLLGVDLRGKHTPGELDRWQGAFVGIAWFAPWLGAALGFADAALALTDEQASPQRTFGEDAAHLATALFGEPLATPFPMMAAASLLIPALFVLFWWSPAARAMDRAFGHQRLLNALRRWSLPGLFLGLAALFFIMPPQAIELTRLLGPVTIICISFAIVTAAGSYLIYFGRRRGAPAFAFVAAAPFLLGAFGFDDNHFLRPLGEMRQLERPHASEALDTFAAANGGANQPIILVSAEGGGIRAAYFTASVLGRLADHCPRLARRVFVVSAVSGGSVGAAAYRASLEDMPLSGEGCNLDPAIPAGPRQRALEAMFSRDHLSPALAKQAFPELIQTFLPAAMPDSERAFFPQSDRQRGLERSLEDAYARAFGVDLETNAFTASAFDAPSQSSGPHLMISMTETSSGGVFVASSLDLSDMRERQPWLHDFRCVWSEEAADSCDRSPDFRLSTMAASSARFPMVSPAGSVRANDATFRFVDGGYFDNSGVEALLAVAESLRRQARERGTATPPIAVLHIDSNPYRQRLPVRWRLDFDVHELQAVLATREERARISLSRLYNLHQDGQLCSLRFVEVVDNNVPLRLGWILSEPAQEDLRGQASGQLAAAFAGNPARLCDNSESAALHAANDRYAERLNVALGGDN